MGLSWEQSHNLHFSWQIGLPSVSEVEKWKKLSGFSKVVLEDYYHWLRFGLQQKFKWLMMCLLIDEIDFIWSFILTAASEMYDQSYAEECHCSQCFAVKLVVITDNLQHTICSIKLWWKHISFLVRSKVWVMKSIFINGQITWVAWHNISPDWIFTFGRSR